MQDKKEGSIWFVETIKEKVRDWGFRHQWPARFLEYILLFLFVAFVISHIFARFDLYYTESDSARYMLSAMVQSQAAIVAIVVTLTLVAVQLTASTYSPRVIRIFRDNPDMWILLLFYGVSISYGLLVLKMIQAGDLRQIPLFGIPLEYHTFSAYIAVTFTFFMLFPYMWNIINLLTPANIINRLKIDITKGNLLNSKEDPIQPILDIVHGSIMKYDIETTRVGLKAVTEQAIEIMKIIGPDDEKDISQHFCHHLERVSRLAINREDEESTIEVIKNLENFWKLTAERRFDFATGRAAKTLGLVGRTAAEKGFEAVAWLAVKSLGEVGRNTAEKGLEVEASLIALREVKITAQEKRLERILIYFYLCPLQ